MPILIFSWFFPLPDFDTKLYCRKLQTFSENVCNFYKYYERFVDLSNIFQRQ
jgi:hypothetical protein